MGLIAGLATYMQPSNTATTLPTQPTLFSSAREGGPWPGGWRLTKIPGIDHATRFDMAKVNETIALRAIADSAAASLSFKLAVSPDTAPILNWRWKITKLIERSDLSRKDGDDYPARVYVVFDYPLERLPLMQRAKLALARGLFGDDLPAAALCYVWDTRAPAGTRAWSAYTDRVRMIVLESGAKRVGQWMAERRDVAEDFREAFGESPPPISGIAVAADTDNTGESVVSYFGDLWFDGANPSP